MASQIDVSELDLDADNLTNSLQFDVREGESFGSDGVRSVETTRREAWDAQLDPDTEGDLRSVAVGEWPTAARLLDERDLSDGEELAYVAIPGWYACLDDNEGVRRTLERFTSWDGFKGAKPTIWAVRDLDQDEGGGAFCLTAVWNEGREQWGEPASKYGMVWPARSCVRIATPRGEPGDLDGEPYHIADGYADDLDFGERDETRANLGKIEDMARLRVKTRLEDVPEQRLSDGITRFEEEQPDDLADALPAALGEFMTRYREITGNKAREGELAAFVEAAETLLDHEPDD